MTREPSAPIWGPARALLVAWIALAGVNAAVLMVRLPSPAEGKLGARLAHHAYDAGHLLALGVVSAALAWLWCRFVPPRRWLSLPAIWLAGSAVGLFVLREDLANFVQRRQLPYPLLCVAVALALPITWELARRLARPKLRWLPIAGGLVLAVGNHLALPFSYPGLHLYAAVIAALAIAGALTTLPRWEKPVTRRRRILTVAGLALLTALAATSIVVIPNRTVWRELFRSPGTVLAPHLARILPQRRGEHRPLAIEGSPWYRDRSNAPARGPSTPALVPKDAIVVFLTIDALRPDVVPKHPKMFPALERVRSEGVEFENARAPSPSTITTIASVFTGKYYSALYWSEIDEKPFAGKFKGAIMPHADPSPRLAELLGKAGVPSAHVIPLHGNAAALGVGTGFSEELLTKRDYGHVDAAMDLLLERLKRHKDGPLFVYSHFVDPHAPYNLAGTQGSEYERYLREVELVDRALRRLLDHLDEDPIGKRTVLMVSADHGEAFGEHNTKYHAVTAYEELVRIPLYIRVPGIAHRTVSEPVTLMDVAPTVLDLYGVPTPGHFMAESLVPFLRGKDPKLERPIAVDAGRRIQALYFPDGKKAIVDIPRRTEEVYDLGKDPGELENLVDDKNAKAAQYVGALRTFFEAHRFKRDGYETPWRPF